MHRPTARASSPISDPQGTLCSDPQSGELGLQGARLFARPPASVRQAGDDGLKATLACQQEMDIRDVLTAPEVALSDDDGGMRCLDAFCGHPASQYAFVPGPWKTAGNPYTWI